MEEFETRTLSQQSRTAHRETGLTQPDFEQRIAVIPLRHRLSESEQRRENILNYREALKQQMKDIEEHKRRERKQREEYDAKKTVEMMSYNPWGRAGGGAPIKDQSGNLISDLNQMHRTNEENYRKCNVTTGLELNGEDTPRPRLRPPLPGHNDSDHSTRQDRYKEELMQQIKENRRRQAEEREQRQIMEEKEEKRLAEEQAQLLKEYKEEEQRNQMKMKKERAHEMILNENNHQKTNKSHKGKNRSESNKENRPPTKDRKTYDAWEQRAPSPPIPTLQHKLTNTNDPGPPSVTSQLSSKTTSHEPLETSLQNHPEATQQASTGDQQDVITELATLRTLLEKEKKHFETKIMRTAPVNEHYPPLTRHQRQIKQERGDAAELRHKNMSHRQHRNLPPLNKTCKTSESSTNLNTETHRPVKSSFTTILIPPTMRQTWTSNSRLCSGNNSAHSAS